MLTFESLATHFFTVEILHDQTMVLPCVIGPVKSDVNSCKLQFAFAAMHTAVFFVCEIFNVACSHFHDRNLFMVVENRTADTANNSQLRSRHCALWYGQCFFC